MRRGEPRAYEAFVERFHRLLLDYARRVSLRGLERDQFVDELLDDIALQFMASGAPLPQNPRMYIIAAFRHKFLNVKRGNSRRDRVIREAVREATATYDFADDEDVVAGCSEGAARASRGPGWESSPLPRVLERLAARLNEGLSEEERQLLVGVAENVPQREIAQWLGVSHAVARKRLERLRARLTDLAMRYTNTLEPDDQRELQRFLRRCNARISARLLSGRSDDSITARGA
jgi:DNA-directed RNA polymerase specialized sigma24 family protein